MRFVCVRPRFFPIWETMARSLEQPGQPPAAQISTLDALGVLVRHRRLELALRIDDAAHACGVAPNVLSRLENGNSVGVDRLLRILSGLGLGMLVTTKENALRYAAEQRSDMPVPTDVFAHKKIEGEL